MYWIYNIILRLYLVSVGESCAYKMRPYSVQLTSGFRRYFRAFFGFEFFLFPNIVHARPPARHTNRWAANYY
jgi:hypothetical protein